MVHLVRKASLWRAEVVNDYTVGLVDQTPEVTQTFGKFFPDILPTGLQRVAETNHWRTWLLFETHLAAGGVPYCRGATRIRLAAWAKKGLENLTGTPLKHPQDTEMSAEPG